MDMQFLNGGAHRLIVKEEDAGLPGEADEGPVVGVGGGDKEPQEPWGEVAADPPGREFESQDYTSLDSVQQEKDKWVEFYDNLKSYLQTGTTCVRNMQKAAESFSLGSEGNIYRTKPPKDGLVFPKTLVIRNYEDRLRICKDIHVNTGVEGIHHRRDKMMELIGQHYYWKGERRDICECIATCEICSAGLGARRKSKPPQQARDVRSPAKLQKLSTSPFTVSSSIATTNPFTSVKSDEVTEDVPTKPSVSLATAFARTLFTDSSRGSGSTATLTTVSEPLDQSQSTSNTTSVGKDLGRKQRCHSDLPSLNSSNVAAVGTCATAFLDPSFSAQGLHIFTTIDEPTPNEDTNGGGMSLSSPSQLTAGQSSGTVPVPAAPVTLSSALGGALSYSQREPETVIASGSSESSVYQLMFQLPSEPNTALCSSVIDAMHMAMQRTADPAQLTKASEACLCQHLGLGPGHSVAVAPSRAAAYVIAVAASMLRVDPLSVDRQLTSRQSSPPLVVVHDACCRNNPLQTCTPLVGAVNWNLGGANTPMDKSTLGMALEHNRVVAVLYQPYVYPAECQQLPLQDVSEVCHSHGVATIVVDATGMHVREPSSIGLIASVKNFLAEGADLVLLPKTGEIRGPPQTCVLIGRSSILGEMLQKVALLQTQVCLPLTSTPHDLVGTVVAFKTLVDTVKQTLGGHDSCF